PPRRGLRAPGGKGACAVAGSAGGVSRQNPVPQRARLLSHLKAGLRRRSVMDNSEIEKRITLLEDIEAIKKLKALYCDICDDDHNQDRIVTIFAEDGIWESKDLGKAQGHAELLKLFKSFHERISFSQHNVMNPMIEVTGNTAKGSWYFFGPFTFRK